jgi:hypothetical protein
MRELLRTKGYKVRPYTPLSEEFPLDGTSVLKYVRVYRSSIFSENILLIA